jgi:hypothetical protein
VRGPVTDQQDEKRRLNLAESLRSTAIDLTKLADGLPSVSRDEEIRIQAEILDRVADDAREGASILRRSVTRRPVPALPPRRIPRDPPRRPPRAV